MFIYHKFPQKLLWYQQISSMQHCGEIGGSAQIWCYLHCYKCCHMQVSCFKLTKLIKSKIKTKNILKNISWILKERSYVNNLYLPHTRISSWNIKVPVLKFYLWLYSIPCVELQLICHSWYYQNMTHTNAGCILINIYEYEGRYKIVSIFSQKL